LVVAASVTCQAMRAAKPVTEHVQEPNREHQSEIRKQTAEARTSARDAKFETARTSPSGYLKAVSPDLFGFVFEVWPAPGARESPQKCGGRSQGPRGRPDLENATPKNPARLPSGTQRRTVGTKKTTPAMPPGSFDWGGKWASRASALCTEIFGQTLCTRRGSRGTQPNAPKKLQVPRKPHRANVYGL
jgi:hypothetical protein